MSFAELHCLTNFTFLEGASNAEDLVKRAHELGLSALAITDRNSLAGVVRAHRVATLLGQKIIIGSEIELADGERFVMLPKDRAAYGRLCRLLSLGRQRAEKGTCRLVEQDLIEWGEGSIILWVPPNEIGVHALDLLKRCKKHFGKCFYGLARHALNGSGNHQLLALANLYKKADVPMLASNHVLFHSPSEKPVADVLTSIREHVTLEEAGTLLQKNAERHLKGEREMLALFGDFRDAVLRTQEVADAIIFSLDELRYEYPDEVSNGQTPQKELIRLINQQLPVRYPKSHYPNGVPQKVTALIKHELNVVEELSYAPYFLTVYDIVRFARSQNILCQGRGSAANSVLCYILGITSVSPERMDMVFERFVSSARDEPPDIDVDFEHERREEVIQYIYEKYGRHRAGLTATVTSYRARSSIREVGKVFGLSQDTIGALASQVWGWSSEGVQDKRIREVGLDPSDPRLALCLNLAQKIIGFPRHLSQHVGGFVITRSRLDEVVPIENAAMVDRTVVEWDKDDLDTLGILKVDVLALGMLSCIRKCFDMMRTYYGVDHDLASLPEGDSATYDMLCKADSVGVFQVESRAQMSFLPRMKPRTFYDLVIEVAIVRPGPIQGDMVHPYLRRRNGEEDVHYPSPALKAVLERTLGVPLFQEQVMKIAIVGAGFSPVEADQLRRAMATFKKTGTIGNYRERFIRGMIKNGYEEEFATRCFKQIEGFGEYGFPESHAASFALLVYVSSWLKCHYPAVFAACLINSQPMGFYAPAQIVRDAREHGVEVRPVDVNFSEWNCTLEYHEHGYAVRLGFRVIKECVKRIAIG